MRSSMALTRIAITTVLAVGLTAVALRIVPGTTAGLQIRMMVFVLLGPWLFALIVVHPGRLASALSSVFSGRPGKGITTLHVLEFLAWMTITAGAVGAFGSFISFYYAASESHGAVDREDIR